MKPKPHVLHHAARLAGLLVVTTIALQLYFAARVALMSVVDPRSTTFQRSEAWRLVVEHGRIEWSQEWIDYDRISPHLKRAVIASEDAGFTEHSGVEWEAIERAWERNLRAEAQAERLNEAMLRRASERQNSPAGSRTLRQPKLVGGSTITQQLGKNLFLSGERTAARKAQEIVIAYMLEALLPKRRILEIYLNNVEWGEGVFGAQAAARRYFRVDAAQLGVQPSARLAVMLPAPKRFEKRPASAYVQGRAATIAARMAGVQPP
jgi:monofunctional biosynthetic peptidoglycan transglycosylase